MIPISQDQQTELAPNHILMHRVSRQENDGTTIYEPLARVMSSDGAVMSSWMAANCGLSIMVHIVIIATVLLLPLFATESLHPYTATRDLIVLPSCPAKGCTYSHETALNCSGSEPDVLHCDACGTCDQSTKVQQRVNRCRAALRSTQNSSSRSHGW